MPARRRSAQRFRGRRARRRRSAARESAGRVFRLAALGAVAPKARTSWVRGRPRPHVCARRGVGRKARRQQRAPMAAFGAVETCGRDARAPRKSAPSARRRPSTLPPRRLSLYRTYDSRIERFGYAFPCKPGNRCVPVRVSRRSPSCRPRTPPFAPRVAPMTSKSTTERSAPDACAGCGRARSCCRAPSQAAWDRRGLRTAAISAFIPAPRGAPCRTR